MTSVTYIIYVNFNYSFVFAWLNNASDNVFRLSSGVDFLTYSQSHERMIIESLLYFLYGRNGIFHRSVN